MQEAVADEVKRRVAAVVVSWNGLDLLARCLAALAAQTRPIDRIIVVDNGSRDIGRLASWSGPGDFCLECLGENRGFAAANNHGLALCADCEFVVLVNPDAFLAPDWLEIMLAGAERYPRAASFACTLLQDDDPGRLDGQGDAYHLSGFAWREGHGEMACDAGEQEVFSACAAAALYRRQAVETAGGFDESFFCYMEDVDLGFRLRLAGWQCMLIPAALARHVGSASSGGKRSLFAVYHGHRNIVWCYLKNMPAALFWLGLPLHLAANLLAVGLYAWRGQFANILRAKRDVLTGIPAIWRKRRVVQSQRKISSRELWRVLGKRLRVQGRSEEKE